MVSCSISSNCLFSNLTKIRDEFTLVNIIEANFVINLVASVIDEILMTVLGGRYANRMAILEAGLIITAGSIQK